MIGTLTFCLSVAENRSILRGRVLPCGPNFSDPSIRARAGNRNGALNRICAEIKSGRSPDRGGWKTQVIVRKLRELEMCSFEWLVVQ